MFSQEAFEKYLERIIYRLTDENDLRTQEVNILTISSNALNHIQSNKAKIEILELVLNDIQNDKFNL